MSDPTTTPPTTQVLQTSGVTCTIERDDVMRVLRVTTHQVVRLTDVALVAQVVRDFLQLLPPRGGGIVIDCTNTEMFTIQQLASIAGELRAQNELLRERLIGTVIRVSESTYLNSILAQFFRGVYVPVRPYELVATTIDVRRTLLEMIDR